VDKADLGRRSASIERAPAKLTTRLRVVGRRADGFHLLEAEMVALDLVDELEFSAGDGLDVLDEIRWLRPGAEERGFVAVGSEPPGTEDMGIGPLLATDTRPNLVQLALQAVGRSAHVRLHKAIPPGAGLGGGSADAAAVLRWAGCADPEVAVGLGADVPFCLAGGRAIVGGIGEILEPLGYEKADVLLVIPRLAVSTPAVYAAWDALGGPSGDYGNDLEPAALVVEPRLAWWRNLVKDTVGERPRLAGSGGTWWIGGTPDQLAEHSRRLSAAIVAAGESAVVQLTSTVPSLGERDW
jgi:4-diphosphocytidyl-2-C-methyl-D-erythritol kinase